MNLLAWAHLHGSDGGRGRNHLLFYYPAILLSGIMIKLLAGQTIRDPRRSQRPGSNNPRTAESQEGLLPLPYPICSADSPAGQPRLPTSWSEGCHAPVSRILSTPPERGWTAISLPARAGPGAADGTGCDQYPGSYRTAGADRSRAGGPFPLFCLAPRGVCRASWVAPGSGELLPPRFTLAFRSLASRPVAAGGLISVALSVAGGVAPPGPPACAGRAALRSPDFPLTVQRTASGRPGRGRPTYTAATKSQAQSATIRPHPPE